MPERSAALLQISRCSVVKIAMNIQTEFNDIHCHMGGCCSMSYVAAEMQLIFGTFRISPGMALKQMIQKQMAVGAQVLF